MVVSEKITFGSDYPFPLGDPELGKFIEESDLEKKPGKILSPCCPERLGLTKVRFE